MADPFEGIEFTPEQQHELAVLRNGFALLNQIVSDPKTATPAKRLIRQIKPDMNVVIPEDDIAEPLLAPIREQVTTLQTKHEEVLKALDEKTAAFDQKLTEREQKEKDTDDLRDLQKRIDEAAKHYRFTDEGRAALIEHMKTTGTPDPMTAGAYLIQNMERPAPVASNGLAPEMARRNGAPDVDLFQVATGHDDESLKLLHAKPEQWMSKEINNILAEQAGRDAA